MTMPTPADPQHSLTGAVIAVLGATGGLGVPICFELERRGATVIRVGRQPATCDVVLDLRDSTAGDTLNASCLESHGRLDGVINAVGVVAFGDLLETDDVVIEELFLTNVLGPLWLMKRVAPLLADSKGFIANISAVVAERPLPGMAAYSASKAALTAADEAIRREWRRMGVRVIDMRPPHTETDLVDHRLAGPAPKLPTGLEPAAVAARIVDAIESGATQLAATDFDPPESSPT